MLKPEEAALCRDVLLEAGVPVEVVDELTAQRVRYIERTRTLRATRRFEEQNEIVRAEERRYLYQQIVQHLVDSGIAQVAELIDEDGNHVLSLDVTVVLPK